MPHKARGTKGRMASPAQMERLRAVLGMQLTQPVSMEWYRHQMRALREQPAMDIEKREAAYEHLERKHEDLELLARLRAFSEALHAQRVRERGDVIQ